MKTYTPLIGRICLGLLFLIVGITKLADIGGTTALIAGQGLPFPLILAGVATAVEIIFGALLILGFKVKYTALILALYTIVVTAVFHSDITGGQQVAFLKNLAIVGGLMYAATFEPVVGGTIRR